jgi:peptidoglycan/LPS O-acetylase OafA/YrhL
LFYGSGGVELFFIISGFCLAYPLVSRSKSESWQRWLLRRAYRILPPYYASVLLFLGLTVVLHLHPFSVYGMNSPPPGPVSFKGLFVCVTLIGVTFNPSYWTLALEARWYFLFPLLIRLWRRAGSGILLFSCALASAAGLWLSGVSQRFVFLTASLFVYLPIFACGMLVARWTAERRTPRRLVQVSPWGVLASVLMVVVMGPSQESPGLIPRVVSYGLLAFFSLLSALHSPRLSAIARLPALVTVGAFSYSLYLIHQPLVILTFALLDQRRLSPAQSFFVSECVVFPFCVGLGYAFYRLVERPLMRHARTARFLQSEPARASLTSRV